MSLIAWDPSWSVGNRVIDYDHQMLVNITNHIYDLRRMPKVSVREVQQQLDQLAKYVEVHFEREEKLFSATKYPDAARHKAMHRELEKVVRDICEVFRRDSDLLNFDEVIDFLKRWLIDHIAKHDKGYSKFLAA